MNINNYIPINRKLFESFLWLEKREFSRAEAWVDLLRRARFEANSTKLLIKGKMIEIHRGEVPASLRHLADLWGWSKNKTDNFLNLLSNEGMLTKRTAKGTNQTIIIISNYDKYNFTNRIEGQSRDSQGTVKGQSRDKTNKEEEYKKRKEDVDVEKNTIVGFEKVENLIFDFRNDDQWIEPVCMKFKISRNEIHNYLDEFELHLKSISEKVKTRRDFASHFTNWLRKHVEVQKNNSPKEGRAAAIMGLKENLF